MFVFIHQCWMKAITGSGVMVLPVVMNLDGVMPKKETSMTSTPKKTFGLAVRLKTLGSVDPLPLWGL